MEKRFFVRMLSFLMVLALCAGMIPAAQAAEKEERQLYMRNGDIGSFSANWEFREDQGAQYASFSTSPDGECIPIEELTLDGVAVFKESAYYSAWLCFSGPGEAVILYETDDAVYSLIIPVTEFTSSGSDVNLDGCNTPNEAHLFANYWDGSGHLHSVDIPIGEGREFWFYFQTADGSVIELDYSDLRAVYGANLFKLENGHLAVNVNGLAQGAIEYTYEGTTYSFPVNGVLPGYGFYIAPERTAEMFTTGFSGAVGETSTLYLMWGDGRGAPQHVTAVLNDMNSTETYDITIDKTAETYWKISFVNPDANCVILSIINEAGYVQSRTWLLPRDYGYDGGSGDPDARVTVDYNGQEVTVGMAWQLFADVETIALMDGGFGTASENTNPIAMDIPVYFGAMVNYGQDDEQPAPAEFYQQIIDTVEFEIVESINTDGTDDATPNLSMTEKKDVRYAGVDTVGVRFQAELGRYLTGRVSMSFTYGGETYTVYNNVQYYELYKNVEVAVSEEDDLNAILASGDALMAWMQEKYPEAYEHYISYSGSGSITLNLPAIAYDEIIYASPSFDAYSEYDLIWGAVRIIGSVDETTGKRTSMPGMVVAGKLHAIGNIDFVANEDLTVTYGNETFTCGVMADSSIVTGRKDNVADVGDLFNCTFYGFDYGIRSTKTGFVGNVLGSTIMDCTYGMYVDGGEGGNSPMFRWNKFINNEVAVTILAIPERATYYNFRIAECAFIHNRHDFHIPIRARFYFYRNWYGHFPKMTKTTTYDESLAVSRSAQIDTGEVDTTIITNPRLVNREDCFSEGYKELGIDNTLLSMILNTEAAELRISGESLASLVGSTDISILGTNEEEIAVWTFENS